MKRHVLPKRWLALKALQGSNPQKTDVFITTAAITSNATHRPFSTRKTRRNRQLRSRRMHLENMLKVTELAPHIKKYLNSNRKAISVTGNGGLQDCEILRIPHCLYSWLTDGGEVVSLTLRRRSKPQKLFFLLLVLISVKGCVNPRIVD
jgi:hypothetical protein